jgi:hypothetical protein
MSLKKPIVRILLILLLVFGGVGYFLFTNFLFNPFEGRYEADISTLVPRNVDFFVAKARLDEDFAEFPRLNVADRVVNTRAWRSFERYEFAGYDQEHGILATLDELGAISGQMGGLNPLDVFGGEDVALAGYFQGPYFAQSDWAAYGRVDWKGKIGLSMLAFPGLIGLDAQGMTAAVEEDYVALSGGQLAREMYIARINDIGIVSSSLELVKSARELYARAGQDSFGQSATYDDNIGQARRGARRNEIELYYDWRAWAETSVQSGRWPDPDSQDFLPRYFARLFQIGSVKSMTGVVGFDNGVTLDLHGELSSELMTTEQKRLYRQRGVERDWLLQRAARMAKADSSLFLFLQSDLGDLLRLALDAAEPALRSNIEDVVRSTGEYNSTDALIADFDDLFKDRIALIIRHNDYTEDPSKDPPHNNVPAPAIAVVLWTDGDQRALDRIEALHQVIVKNQGRLGLKGRDGQRGVFKNRVTSGHTIWEFWNPLIDGTGHLSTVVDSQGFYAISNNFRMLGDLIQVYFEGGSSFPRLSERLDFRNMVDEGLAQSNGVLWVNPRELGVVQRRFHQMEAVDQVRAAIDWRTERAREEDKVLREQFPGKVRGRLDQDTQDALDVIVNPRMDALEQRLISEQVPAIQASLDRGTLYSELVSGFLVMLSLDPKHFDLTASAVIPLDE